MQRIITFTESYTSINNQKIDSYQNIIEGFVKNDFFVWTFLVLLLNHNNWKRSVIYILVVHWILKSIKDILNDSSSFTPRDPDKYWPYTKRAWLIYCALADTYWILGEIIGDWYPFLRVRAITNNNKNIRNVFVICVLYSSMKIAKIYCYFAYTPTDFRLKDKNGNIIKDILIFKTKWWSVEIIIQLIGIIYNLSVIYALKINLSNKIKQYNIIGANNIINKFKQISEFRITFSMIISLIFIPFIVGFAFCIKSEYEEKNTPNIPLDEAVNYLSHVASNINYTIMYIDQILLRLYFNNPKILLNNSNTNKSIDINTFSKFNKSQNPQSNDISVTPVYTELSPTLSEIYLGFDFIKKNDNNELLGSKKYIDYKKYHLFRKEDDMDNIILSGNYKSLNLLQNKSSTYKYYNTCEDIIIDCNNGLKTYNNDDSENSLDMDSYLYYYQNISEKNEIDSIFKDIKSISYCSSNTLFNESYSNYFDSNNNNNIPIKVSNKKITIEEIPTIIQNKLKIERKNTLY